jgi:hypothetical protein
MYLRILAKLTNDEDVVPNSQWASQRVPRIGISLNDLWKKKSLWRRSLAETKTQVMRVHLRERIPLRRNEREAVMMVPKHPRKIIMI